MPECWQTGGGLPSLDEISELVNSNEPRVQAALDSLHRPAQMAEQLDHPLRAPSRCMLRQDVWRIGPTTGT